MEKYSVDKSDLKYYILDKVEELVECIQKLGKTELFQITVKYMNGELITSTDFSGTNTMSGKAGGIQRCFQLSNCKQYCFKWEEEVLYKKGCNLKKVICFGLREGILFCYIKGKTNSLRKKNFYQRVPDYLPAKLYKGHTGHAEVQNRNELRYNIRLLNMYIHNYWNGYSNKTVINGIRGNIEELIGEFHLEINLSCTRDRECEIMY